MTISFSYVYLKGLHLGIGPSSPVVIKVHLLNLLWSNTTFNPNVSKGNLRRLFILQPAYLAISPRRIFSKTVSAMSSALCPVTILSAFSRAAPRSSAYKEKSISEVGI